MMNIKLAVSAAAFTYARAASLRALSISASPITSTSPSVNFEVSWSGVNAPESSDWVAVYCVGAPLANWGVWNYVNICTGWASGQCSLSFPLDYSSMGCDVEFRMYRDPSPYTLLGTSNPVNWTVPSGGSAPRHVHVAYGTQASTEMSISWTSDDGVTPAILMLGTKPGQYELPNVTAGFPSTYTASDSCGPPADWTFPGYFHHALVTELQPNTRYFALPVQGSAAGSEITFVTGKTPAAETATQFIVYADMDISGGNGASMTATRVAARVQDNDFLLHIGDLSYAEGRVQEWNTFMEQIEPVASFLPYHVSIGNHEYDYSTAEDGSKDPSGAGKMFSPPFWNGGTDSGGECGMPTSRRFRTPGTGNGVFWYSFSVGNVHIAMVSSEHDPSPGAPMGDWLIADLAAVDRTITPWSIVGIHRPIVETEMYPGDYAVAAGLRAIMEPYLLQYKVDVVMAGHYHSFQRSCPMANLTCVPAGGIVHYTTGAAGAGLDAAGLYPSTYIDKTILGQFGYSVVTAPNSSALHLVFHVNGDDSVGDDVWIYH